MGLDIRLPVGLLFSLIGALMGGYGAVSNKAIYQRSLGLNINLAWGVVLMIFGLTMLILGYRGMKVRLRGEASSGGSTAESIHRRDV